MIGAGDGPSAGLPPLLGGRIRAPVIAALGLVVLALIVAGVGAYVFLPSASITVVPRRDPIGPIELTVAADPQATAVDAVNGVVPAVEVPVPVEAAQTFTTTGVHVEEAAAKGSVTFTNYDTDSGDLDRERERRLDRGRRSGSGQSKAVALQPAAVSRAIQPGSEASVAVVAVKPGTRRATCGVRLIRVVPGRAEDSFLLGVNNPNPTTGGVHTETPEVTQAEVDKAIAALQAQLDQEFSDAVAAGAGAPAGTTVFAATKDLPAATPDIDPQSLVGQAVATFDLKLSATGTVIAVDPRPVRTIAETQLASKVAANHRLVDGSADVVVGEGTVGEDGQVTFQATARAEQVAIVDPAALRALVKGKTAADARAALAPFGTATVTLWPDWATTVTGIDARLAITVDDAAGDGPRSSPTPGSGSALTVRCSRVRQPAVRGRAAGQRWERRAVSRILGLDLGEKRIGVAVADADGMAVPLTTLRRAATIVADAAAIARLAAEQGATEIVVGLPLEAAGQEGAQARLTRAWVAEVQPLLEAPLRYRDERLTSHLAEERLGPMKRGRSGGPPSRTQRDAHRARVDREAAAIILQDELDARAAHRTPATEANP